MKPNSPLQLHTQTDRQLTCSDVVTIETIRGDSPKSEVLLKSEADGGLSRSTETGEPDTAASESTTLSDHLTTLISRHMTGFEGNVSRLY